MSKEQSSYPGNPISSLPESAHQSTPEPIKVDITGNTPEVSHGYSGDCATVPTTLATIGLAFKGLEWLRRRKNAIALQGKVSYTEE